MIEIDKKSNCLLLLISTRNYFIKICFVFSQWNSCVSSHDAHAGFSVVTHVLAFCSPTVYTHIKSASYTFEHKKTFLPV